MIGSYCSIIQLLLFSFIGISLLIISLLLGLALYNLKLNHPVKTYFLNIFLGLFTIVCFYSFALVGIKTINIITGIILLYLFQKNTHRFKIEKIDLKPLLPILYIFPVVFILYGGFQLPVSIENDVRFYAKISYALTNIKQENIYHFYNSYNENFNGVMPYHYFELWITSLLNTLLNIKSIITLKYITYPFLISCVAYGTLGFIKKNRFLYFLLFIGLSLLPFHIVSIFKSGFIVYTDFWLRPNFTTYYFTLLAVFYLIIEKRWLELYLISIITCTVSIVIVPCIIGALFVLSGVLLYKKVIYNKDFWFLNSLLVVFFIIMFLLYSAYSPNLNLLASDSIWETIHKSMCIWKAVLYTIVTLIVECSFLVIIAFIINKYLVNDKNLKNIYIFIFFQIIIGVILFQIVNQLDNAYQFPYISFSASGFILIIMVLNGIETIKNKMMYYFITSIILCSSIYISYSSFDFSSLSNSLERKNLSKNNVSPYWVNEVTKYIDTHKNAKGGFVLSSSDLYDFSPKSRNCVTIQMGSFICYLTDNCNLPDLTCKNITLSDKTTENRKFFGKAESWIKAFPNYKNQCNVLEYIKNGEIDYFICTKKTELTDSSIVNIISDSESNYMFVSKK